MISMKTVTLNGHEVFPMPWRAQSPQPWLAGYSRVGEPYVDGKGRHRCRTIVVRNSKLRTTSQKFKPKKAA
jgi:hypothetical protein